MNTSVVGDDIVTDDAEVVSLEVVPAGTEVVLHTKHYLNLVWVLSKCFSSSHE